RRRRGRRDRRLRRRRRRIVVGPTGRHERRGAGVRIVPGGCRSDGAADGAADQPLRRDKPQHRFVGRGDESRLHAGPAVVRRPLARNPRRLAVSALRPAAGEPVDPPPSTAGGRASIAALAALLFSPLGRQLLSFGVIGVASTAAWAVLYLLLRRWLGPV